MLQIIILYMGTFNVYFVIIIVINASLTGFPRPSLHWTKDSQVIVNSTKVLHNENCNYSLLSNFTTGAVTYVKRLKKMSTQNIIVI